MKSVVVLISTVAVALATFPAYNQYYGPPAPIGHDGRVLDTPEVADAKAAHLAAVAEAAAKVPYGSTVSYSEDGDEHDGYAKPMSTGHQMYHSGYGYHGPPAPLGHDGRVVDTPEVAQAKAAHSAAYNHVASSAPYREDRSQLYESPSYSSGYHGPTAPLSHDGRVVDTPEVAHARRNHFAVHASALHPGHHGHYGAY